MVKRKIAIVFVLLTIWCGSSLAEQSLAFGDRAGRPTADSVQTLSYDGVWFMGFNSRREVFAGEKGLQLRRHICNAIDRNAIARNIMGASEVPDSIIPAGMAGYRKGLILTGNDGVQVTPSRLVLVCTDGVKTQQAASAIVSDCARIGVTVEVITVNYSERNKFEETLAGGAYDLFLMGYKTASGATAELMRELFTTNGPANFFSLADARIDAQIQAAKIDPNAYNAVQENIWEQRLMLPIFYIEGI